MLRKEVEEKIQARVQEHYDYLVKRIPVERIIGAFAYGSMNYGFYEEGVSDVDTKAIVLPSFEDIMGGQEKDMFIVHWMARNLLKTFREFIK